MPDLWIHEETLNFTQTLYYLRRVLHFQFFCLSFFLIGSSAVYGQDWQTLYAKLNSHYTGGTYGEGIAIGEKVLLQAEKEFGKSHENYGHTLTMLGHLHNLTLQYKQAGLLYEQALGIYKQTFGEKHIYYGTACLNLANVWKSLSRYEEAEALYKVALGIFKTSSGESTDYAGYSLYLAQLYELVGKYDLAETIYKEAVRIYKLKNGETSPEYANGLFALAQHYEKAVRYPEAENIYMQAIALYKKTMGETHVYYYGSLNYLAHVYHMEGQYSEAELYYKQSLDICRKAIGEKHEYYASILNNLGNLNQVMGRNKEAEIIYTQVSAIYKELLGEKHSHYATSLNNLALLYVENGEYEKAEVNYKKASEIYRTVHGDEHPYYANALINLGHMHLTVGNYKMAEDFYKSASEILKKSLGEKHPDYAETLNALGLIYKNMGDSEGAEALYMKALAIEEQTLGENHPKTGGTLNNLASLYQYDGKLKEAAAYYLRLNVNLIYQIQHYFPALSEKEKELFYQTIDQSFEKFNSFAAVYSSVNPGIAGEMYNNQLITKALILNSSNKLRDNILNSKDEEVIKLYRDWKYKKEVMGKTFTMSKEEIVQKEIDVKALANEINELEKKISLKSQAFALHVNNKPTWKNVQEKLLPNEAAVEVIRFRKSMSEEVDSVYYAVLVLKYAKAPLLVLLKNGNEMEKKHFHYYRNAINSKVEDKNSYLQYWQPFASYLQGSAKIYFSPDGVYNKISLNSLVNTETGKFLIEEANISLVSNTKDLIDQKLKERATSPIEQSAHIFGYPDYNGSTQLSETNYAFARSGLNSEIKDSLSRFFSGGDIPELEGTKLEVMAIAQLLQSKNIKSTLHLRAEASEDQLKNINNPSILHIATHGFFLQDKDLEDTTTRSFAGMEAQKIYENPLLRSGLLFSGVKKTINKTENKNKTEDGILTAYEGMNLNLNKTTLVTLSACETGLGEIKNGEGVYGLQRAFQIAGARYVIMSLWKVNDNATQELMVSFYKKWLESNNIQNAFKEAQIEMKGKYKYPYFWASFILTGI
jgi:CHAT domain-containing protein